MSKKEKKHKTTSSSPSKRVKLFLKIVWNVEAIIGVIVTLQFFSHYF